MHARGGPLALGLLLAVALWAPRPAVAASEGTGLYVGPTALPWVENQVTIDVALGLARGEVHQRFWNNTGRAVEAVYVFPLPTGAVVTGMSMEVGGRRVDGVIAPRASAVAGYERAIASGHAAALTERERPGVYTQSLAGIPADGTVVVTLRWQARLTRHQGEWELAHPLVVGPRFTPGQATGLPTVGAGTSPDTDRAPDASRVTPPRDRAATVRFLVTTTLHDAGAVTSPTHTLTLGHGDDSVIASIDDPRGNRELVLRWRRAGLGVVRAFAEAGDAGTYVAVLVEPPAAAAPPRHTPRSWLVAIDRSASMQGASEAQARRLAHAIVASLGPGDRAAIVAVGAKPRWSGADAASRKALDERIDHLPAFGGDLTAGLAVTLAGLPKSPPPAVVLITDGLVADDAAAVARATAARVIVHPVGVGTAPNRWLLEAIAAGTGGSAHVAIDPDDAEVIAAEMVAAADAQPVAVDWLRPSVTDAMPARAVVVPGGSALIVAVDPRGVAGAPGEVEVVVGGERIRAPITAVRGTELATEWARQRITHLEATGKRAAATELALARGLVSSTTALVAIAPVRGDVVQSTVTVPLPLPAGVRPASLAGSSGDVFDLEPGRHQLDVPTGGTVAPEVLPPTDASGEDSVATESLDDDDKDGAKTEHEGRPGATTPVRDPKAKKPKPTVTTAAGTTATPEPIADRERANRDALAARQAAERAAAAARRAVEERRRKEAEQARLLENDADGVPDDKDQGGAGRWTTDDDEESEPDANADSNPDAGDDRDTRDTRSGDDDDDPIGGRSGGGAGGAGPRTSAAPPPPPAPVARTYAADGESYDMVSTGESILARRAGGQIFSLSVGLGARVDEGVPAGQLSLALDRRLARTGFAAGLRLDLLAAPSADRPLSAALLVTLARNLAPFLTLDLGLGPAYDGRAGLGYAAGLTFGRGALGFGLRFDAAATAGTDPAAVTGNVTVGF